MKETILPIKEILHRKEMGREIYCFGAGQALKNILANYPDYHLEEYVSFVVDNSANKIGETINIGDRKISVIGIDQLVKSIRRDDFILITSNYIYEIVGQLSQYKVFDHIEYCGHSIALALQHDEEREKVCIPDRLSIYDEVKIPKIIHYCWFGKTPIPVENQKWMDTWKKYCPDFEIVEWNESNFDITQNEYVMQAYQSGKWAFVSDFARVDVIERFGGVYLDTDVELVRNIDELLKNDAFCGFESEDYVAFGLGFGAVKHHSIIKKLRDDYFERSFVLGDGSLNLKTCPQYQTELLQEYGLKLTGEFQTLAGITVLPEIVLSGMSIKSKKIISDLSKTYAIHHYVGSWM